MVCSHAALPILAIILHQHCTYSAGACMCLAFPTLAPLALLALFAPFAQLSLLALLYTPYSTLRYCHHNLALHVLLSLYLTTMHITTNIHISSLLYLHGQVATSLTQGGANFI
jgi:hypothetical protein